MTTFHNQSIFATLRGEKEPPPKATPLYRSNPNFSVVKEEEKVETIEDIARRFDQDLIAKTVEDNTKKKETVFVYGTLKRAGQRGSLLSSQEFIGDAITGINYDLKRTGPNEPFDFPVLLQNSKYIKGRQYLSRVLGELWNIDLTTLNILDGIENVPKMFERKRIQAYLYDISKGHILEPILAQTYIGTPDYWEHTKLYDCEKMDGKSPHLYYPVKNKGIVT